MRAEDELRRRVAVLVVEAGEQQLFARSIGVHQSVVSRYLSGGKLTPAMARGLHAHRADLRALVTTVHFAGSGMPLGNTETAEAAAS